MNNTIKLISKVDQLKERILAGIESGKYKINQKIPPIRKKSNAVPSRNMASLPFWFCFPLPATSNLIYWLHQKLLFNPVLFINPP